VDFPPCHKVWTDHHSKAIKKKNLAGGLIKNLDLHHGMNLPASLSKVITLVATVDCVLRITHPGLPGMISVKKTESLRTARDGLRSSVLRCPLTNHCRCWNSKSRQPQNPRTIAPRSHRSSLVGCTSRENTIQSRWPTWDRASSSRPPSSPPTSTAVRAGGRVFPQFI
jgi:hypothetical protein